MPDTPVVVFASFRPRPDAETRLLDLLTSMADATRREPGNETYRLFSAGSSPNTTFHLFERYESTEALEAHREADYYTAYRAQLPDLLAEPIEVLILDELHGPAPA